MSSARQGLGRAGGIVWALTSAELKSERDFSLLGILKWMLEPLSYMAIYFLLVGVALNRSQPAYPLFLMCALIPWRYFSGVVIRSMDLLRKHSSTIVNRRLPREVFPVVLLAAEGFAFLVALVLFIPFMLVYSIPPTATILWLPVIILVLILVTAGPTYLGALFGLYFPDLKGVAQNLIRATFFLSAALIPLELIPGDTLPLLIQANPLTGIFEAFRAVIVFQSPPQAAHVLYPAAFGVVALAIGLALYRSRQAEFAKAL